VPYHLKKISFKKIELAIPRKYVNAFLGELWDEFSRTIGKVACFHNYFDTDDPQIYEYNISWSANGLPFTAEISFFNHTNKGLMYALIGAVDSDTEQHDPVSEEKIIKAFKNTLAKSFNQPQKPTFYVQISLEGNYQLSGDYKFPKSNLFFSAGKNTNGIIGYVTFPIYSTNKGEISYDSIHRAVQIAAVLTTLTQQYFSVVDDAQQKIINADNFQEQWDKKITTGGFVDSEIIEAGDCVVNERICLPNMADELFSVILSEDNFKLSCSRFSEGLSIRKDANPLINENHLICIKRSINNIHLISYELIAYVAAIEALLDTSPKKIDVTCPSCEKSISCSSCGKPIVEEDRKISEKFRTLVKDCTGNNPIFEKAFKELYDDRSKFVHTGINLHNFFAYPPNRPIILLGKRHLSDLPGYYHNIHEYTGYLLRIYFCRQITAQ